METREQSNAPSASARAHLATPVTARFQNDSAPGPHDLPLCRSPQLLPPTFTELEGEASEDALKRTIVPARTRDRPGTPSQEGYAHGPTEAITPPSYDGEPISLVSPRDLPTAPGWVLYIYSGSRWSSRREN